MNNSKVSRLFYEMHTLDKPQTWRLILAPVVFIISVFVITIPFSVALLFTSPEFQTILETALHNPSSISVNVHNFNPTQLQPFATPVSTAISLMSVAIWILPLIFTVHFIHGRNWKSILSYLAKIRWNRLWYALYIYALISIGFTLLGLLLNYVSNQPQSIQLYTSNFTQWLLISLSLIPLIFLQVLAEEMVFRGYLFQYLHKIVSSIWYVLSATHDQIISYKSSLVASILAVILFGLAHSANEPFHTGIYVAAQYFILAGFLQYITWRDNGIELAVGAHACNNILAILFMGSVIEKGSTSLFIDTTPAISQNNVLTLVIHTIPLFLFVWLVFRQQKTKLK